MSQTTSSSDLVAYRQQVFNFVASLSIKYTPLITALNAYVESLGYPVDDTNPTTWKYYVNLQGLYHPSDTVMTVSSLDTKTVIDFTVDNLQNHVRTAEVYVPGTSYYTTLCARYPAQVDLVKSIVYPISDLDSAISADDFTILSYATDVLEPDEFSFVFQELQKTLDYVSTRWNFSFLSYEPYFTWVFWGTLWHMLLGSIFASRVKAIKTVNVHSWHIWQYLTSKGLSDYSNVLNRQQSMFLYRNIDYLLANRGKQSNLIALVNNLLGTIGVGLYGRVVYQQTVDGATTCELTPELVATIIPTVYSNVLANIPASTISDMTLRLISAGDEVDQSAEHVGDVIRTLGDTTLNIYPTKLVEIRPLQRDKRYADFFNVFVLDTLMYAMTQNLYQTTIELSTAIASTVLELSLPESMALYYYAIVRSTRQTPTLLPVFYNSYTAFSNDPDPIPPTITFNDAEFSTASLIDLTQYTAGQYPLSVMTRPIQFSKTLGQLFLTALYQITQCRLSASLPAKKAMRIATDCLTVNQTYSIDLIPGTTTYEDWLTNTRPDVQALITLYENSSNPLVNYADLSDAILAQIVPITPILTQYGNFTITDSNYAQLRALFVQLCSYNITFLDTTRDINQFFYVTGFAIDAKTSITSGDPDIPIVALNKTAQETNYTLDITPNDIVFSQTPVITYTARVVSTQSIGAARQSNRLDYMTASGRVRPTTVRTGTSTIIPVGLGLTVTQS